MRVAIATMKRLSISKKREFKYQVRNNDRLTLPDFFDKKVHTLVCDYKTLTVTEAQMQELSNPDVVFVTYEDFVGWLRSGKTPQRVSDKIRELMDARLRPTKISEMFVRSASIKANEEAIEHHTTNKPMLRAELKKKKLAELKEIALKHNVDLTSNKRVTKQVIIARIIAKKVEDEKIF